MKPLLASLALLLAACADKAVTDDHDCTPGAAECHVQGLPNQDVTVTCNNNAECHVECTQSSSCEVDCGGSTECHVTCPATGCTVTDCTGDCEVTCGLTGVATRTGTTMTCP